MSFTRVGPFGVNDQLTSAQCNTIDLNAASAVDKTAAGDTVSGALAFTGAASAISMGAAAVNGITVANGSKIVNNGTMTFGATCVGTLTNGCALTIAGAGGVVASAAQAINVNVAGGITTSAAGGVALNGGATDWVTYSATRSYSKTCPLIAGGGTGGALIGTAWTIAGRSFIGPATTATQIFQLPFLHNGARLSSVTFAIAVGAPHGGVPAALPSFDVRRRGIVAGGATDVSLFSAGARFFTPGPATGVIWYGGGLVQLWTGTCDQNHTIDTTQYIYDMFIVDENGANSVAGNIYTGMILNFTLVGNNAPA